MRDLIRTFYFPGVKLNTCYFCSSCCKSKGKVSNATSHVESSLPFQVTLALSK